ncbi:type II toxin-antitoxin system RelE/ParE family toxin [Actomonas aquatica]|uniref:Type II toxin-antitoxin system RelE/ParE family toxin n=1 Tax=Actomonas aquatica TaxID=2866162 RepID=A0ABZ1C2Q6_9BACT|nr:type II toxin-antitoxin system RelE/ParE family toxin [Opitutus sp. WL0086]WRQ85870.1 type II toxin-antitoxin system RelE/ParE family toxin [Opitutus sp. WL0086]
MSRAVVFRREARLEFDEALIFYEEARQGLGLDFQQAVGESLSEAATHPTLFRKVRGPIRRIVLKRFPYTLNFVAEKDRIVVLAVFHARRDPRHLTTRR